VTVLFTTTEYTLAALETAAQLAKNLELQIRVLAVDIVPFPLPLDQPLVPGAVREQQLTELVARAGVCAGGVTLERCLGRDRRQCLRYMLSPSALIIIGGRTHWWSEEQKIRRCLCQWGHQVVLVRARREPLSEWVRNCFLW